jgi:hypothetical protein
MGINSSTGYNVFGREVLMIEGILLLIISFCISASLSLVWYLIVKYFFF